MDKLTTEEVLHLGQLARITVTAKEADHLKDEISDILGYVAAVKEIAADTDIKVVGARYNVMREDEVINEPGSYTEDLLSAAPEREGQYVKVKKILNN